MADNGRGASSSRPFPGLRRRASSTRMTSRRPRRCSIPGLDTVVSKVMEYGFERVYYLENIADNVRVTPRMFPRLHRYLGGAANPRLHEPEMYVTLDPSPNAFTYGHTRPFIVLTSGLVDMLDDEERCSSSPTSSVTSSPATCSTRCWPRTSPPSCDDRQGDARHRGAARPGARARAPRLVPQGGALRRSGGLLCVQDLDPCCPS